MRNKQQNETPDKRRWATRLPALVVVVVVVTTALVFGASALVDSDWARNTLIQKLERASGRHFHADKLTMRLTPNLQIDATGLTLSNPEWARSGPDFLRAESAALKISLLPLLIGRVHVDDAQMEGVQLFLERDATADNWRFASTADKNDAGTQTNASAARSSFLPDRLSIRRATVQYRTADGKTMRWQLPSLSLSSTGVRKVQAEMQVSAGGADAGHDSAVNDVSRVVRLSARADNLSDFSDSASTSFAVDAAVPGQAGAGNIHADGVIGLGRNWTGTDLRLHIDIPPDSPWQGLTGMPARKLAAIKLDATLQERAGGIDVGQLAFAFGSLRVTGQGTLHHGQSPLPLRIDAQLQTDYLDWAQMTLDAGLPQPPAKLPGALFRDIPLAWPALQRVHGFTADIGLRLGLLKLRSGVPLQKVKLQVQLQPDQMRVPSFSAEFMGGSATADALFTAHDRQVKLNLKANGISIEQWRTTLHKPLMLAGAPLAVDATVSAKGSSMNQLASTLTGPVSLRMGHAVVHSAHASEAETALTGLIPAMAGQRADHMEVVCIVAHLPFDDGLAKGSSIAGARTESSQLLTDGSVDLRDQTLDLHGRVTGINGAQLGASILVGAVNIGGKLVKPRFRLDGRGVIGTAARIGAAVLSFGLTAVGQSILDANADDACKVAGQHPLTVPQ